MSTPSPDNAVPGRAGVRRRPEQLLLAFLGELVVDRDLDPLPTSELIAVLAEHGVGQASTRATLTRMAARGLLEPVRAGRAVTHRLTPACEQVLREARGRIFAEDPFAPRGSGWTLVTFSVPESRRDVRHRVRAQLAWAGFGPLRDGLWIAPGEVDLTVALGGLRGHVPSLGDPDPHAEPEGDLELVAFRAHEVPGFSVARSIRTAWRLEEMKARHEQFQALWADRVPEGGGAAALRDLTALVADWLDLLRAVPRLPAEHLDPAWPSARSVVTFSRLHSRLVAPARVELARRIRS